MMMFADNTMLMFQAFSVLRLIGAIVIGLVIALIMKSQMTNVKHGTTASYYVRENSLDIVDKSDVYLYSRTTSRKVDDD